MTGRGLVFLLISLFAVSCYGVLFSELKNHQSLIVTATHEQKPALKAGEDKITVTWTLNTSFPAGTDSSYKMVKVKLCYAPVSQKDRGWRKTVDELKRDKTCQFKIVDQPYVAGNNTFVWTIERNTPTATYFVRAYAVDGAGHEVGYGETTDALKKKDLFMVQSITGRHVSLDIAAVCFSAFSVVSLFGFFFVEKRKGRASKK